MKKFRGTVKIKFGSLDIFPTRRPQRAIFFSTTTNKLYGITSVSCYSTFFGRLPRQADTVQCPVQAKQKMQNITLFATMVERPTKGLRLLCGLNLSSFVSMFVLTRALFADNGIL